MKEKRLLFTIISLLLCTFTFGQVSQNKIASKDIYQNVVGLVLPDSISYKDVVNGFSISNGSCGDKFQLDSNMTFKEIDFCCTGRSKVDSGSWIVKDRNIIILKSSKQTLQFDVVKFDNFYFFIQPSQRQRFTDDIISMRLKYKNAKPVTIDNRIYTVDYLIGISLIKKYYVKEIDDTTGT